jgi:hypothetical protein
MRLFNRHKEPEQVCPNCADLRETPKHASKPMEEASTKS